MRRKMLTLMMTLAVASGLTVGCTRQEAAEVPRIEEKSYAITPDSLNVNVGILTGTLSGLSVLQRVNADSGEVVYPPQLRGSLELKNTSQDQSVRLVGATIRYLDDDGKPIPLAEGRGATSLTFSSYSNDRLDPGMTATNQIDLPFPAKALDGVPLADLRLDVTYLPMPYRAESVTVPVVLAPRN